MEIQWLVIRNQVTADEVQRFAERQMLPMMEAKRQLVNEHGPILQFRFGLGYEWEDVPTVVIPWSDHDAKKYT